MRSITVRKMVMKLRHLFWVNQRLMPGTCSSAVSGREAWALFFKRGTSSSKLLTP